MNPSRTSGRVGRAILSLLCAAMIALVATTGWAAWTHGVVDGYDVWSLDGALKFRYGLSNQQWWNYSTVGASWQVLSATGRSDAFVGGGGWFDLGNGFSYSYYSPSNSGWFKKDGTLPRFAYYYVNGRWCHAGSTGGWQFLGNPGLTASFMGDGAFHDLGNGFSYAFGAKSDSGWFKKGTLARFAFYYVTGLWLNAGTTGGWQKMGNPNLSASFMGDAAWHDLGNGFTYSYYAATDSAWYKKGGTTARFAYYYGPGRWVGAGSTGGWQYIGGVNLSAGFLGDSSWHDLTGGLTYRYVASLDRGYYQDGGALRFAYGYANGAWLHYSGFGGWNQLSAAGRSAAYMGDGAFHDLGNGFLYEYLADGDLAYFRVGSEDRFSYTYAGGQWKHGRSGAWANLGNSGLSSGLIGDGSTRTLGNGFSYRFVSGSDLGYFSAAGADRFSYGYGSGQWQHGRSTSWANLGGAAFALDFIGDGSYHDLGGGWSYKYDSGTGSGIWYLQALDVDKFSYGYTSGRWFDWDRLGNKFALGNTGASPGDFVGDGTSRTLGNGFSYRYLTGTDIAYFTNSVEDRFSYAYGSGQWQSARGTSWADLGASGLSGAFLGDGTYRDLANGFQFKYSSAGDLGYFRRGADDRLAYAYVAGQWQHGRLGLWSNIGAAASGPGFLGDGSYHDMGNGFSYKYLIAGDLGYFQTGGDDRFAYRYDSGQWRQGRLGSWANVGNAGFAPDFMGNGSAHELGNGWWYTYAAGTGSWARSSSANARFSYNYSGGQWYQHYGSTGYELGDAGQDLQFRGDGSRFQVIGGTAPWSYAYDYALDRGTWQKTETGSSRFGYGYGTGQWFQYDEVGPHTLGAAGFLPTSFVGSGTRYDVTDGGSTWWYGYDYSSDKGLWARGETDPVRFSYAYGNGQWYQHEDLTGNAGYALGFAGKSVTDFIGDGERRLVATGTNKAWWYAYSGDAGYWYTSETAGSRFAYAYSTAQWLHYDWNGGADRNLGQSGTSLASFIGDGSAHTVTAVGLDTWQYSYDYASALGYWSRPDKGTRFSYDYDDGQWYHVSFGNPSAIGMVNSHCDYFPGEGVTWYMAELTPTSGTWRYLYDYSNDTGLWSRSTGPSYPVKFDYDYTNGRWYDTPTHGVRYQLGADARSADFAGYETTVALGTWKGRQWWYTYDYDANEGAWAIDSGTSGRRFSYAYESGQWYQYDAFSPYSRNAIGATSALGDEFMGDAAPRLVIDNGSIQWWFAYDYSNDKGNWSKDGSTPRFTYDYANAAWWDDFSGFSGSAYRLSASGTGSAFIADGALRTLGNWNGGDWWFKYKYVEDEGWWARDTTASGTRFSYAYGTGQWYHHNAFGTYDRYALGNTGARADEPVGSGDWRNVGALGSSWTWYYNYDYATDGGAYSVNDTASNRLRYVYSDGTWGFWERGDRWVTISQTYRNGAFIGSGSWQALWDMNNGMYQWEFSLASADQFQIRSVFNATWVYLGYNFATSKWMDGGLGYPLADITNGSSPYWLKEATAYGFMLESSKGHTMVVRPRDYINNQISWLVIYYYPTFYDTPLTAYRASDATLWVNGSTSLGMVNWVNHGVYGPSSGRP